MTNEKTQEQIEEYESENFGGMEGEVSNAYGVKYTKFYSRDDNYNRVYEGEKREFMTIDNEGVKRYYTQFIFSDAAEIRKEFVQENL